MLAFLSFQIQRFLLSVKRIYQELPNNLNKIFEPRAPFKVKDISELNIQAVIRDIFTQTAIHTEKKNPDGSIANYNLIPRASSSLKVLAEFPIIVVLIYQLCKSNVNQEIESFIPLIATAITLQPAPEHKNSQAFNKEVFVDFMAAQIKTLSFLAYIVRIYPESANAHSTQITQGILNLLRFCPQEVAHLRKELLIAARHILATDIRVKFVPCIDQVFDENILIGNGWTAHETLRPIIYSTIADLVHHVRNLLKYKDLISAINLFSKNIHDESLPTAIQIMSCKLLLNLVECLRNKAEVENIDLRDILLHMLEVFVLKFKNIALHQLPVLMNKQVSQPPSITSISSSGSSLSDSRQDDIKSSLAFPSGVGESFAKDDKPKFGFPPSPSVNYAISDCRSLVKTLVCGAKTITWGIPAYKTDTSAS